MAEFARSSEVHKTLRAVWDDSLKPLGYRRCRGNIASYFRPSSYSEKHVRFWIQISQWGDNWSGSRFRVTFDTNLDDPHSGFWGADNVISTLPVEALEEAERISESIIGRIPKPPEGHWIYEMMIKESESRDFWRKSFTETFEYRKGLFTKNKDIWFNYFSREDVAEWGAYLSKFLPSLIDRIDKENSC